MLGRDNKLSLTKSTKDDLKNKLSVKYFIRQI